MGFDGLPRRAPIETLALFFAIVALGAEPAMADPGIEFRLPGSQTKTISATEIADEADVTARDYTVRSGSGEEVVSRSGLSIRKAVQLVGADPNTIGVLEIVRPNGRTLRLTAADLADPPPFPDGPALVSVDGQTTRFLRPVRNGSDVNADDDFAIDNGRPLVVHVDKDNAVAVTSEADRTTVKAGETVTFHGFGHRRASGRGLRGPLGLRRRPERSWGNDHSRVHQGPLQRGRHCPRR